MSLGDDVKAGVTASSDPRAMLADWANQSDEWARYVVRQVLSTGRPLPSNDVDHAYTLFRQEKSLDERVLPPEPTLQFEASPDEIEQLLVITKISEVTGVNALVPGSVIEPHAGLTILFGENGTGKTGYARVFKALADSRTADVILGDVGAEAEQAQSAKIAYVLGGEEDDCVWEGQRGQAPFTRMSIFDSPSVNFHVDDDLEYVYTPAALALFNHVIAGIKAVQAKVDAAILELGVGSSTLLGRFPKESTVYPLIETLGASTDLTDLKARANSDPKADERIDALRRAVAALEANTIDSEISLRQRAESVLTQASTVAMILTSFDVTDYNESIAKRAGLQAEYKVFRAEMFKAADLPADPEDTWESFVSSGEAYRAHLDGLGVYDDDRCIYCRQMLDDPAKDLVKKYGNYLADKISADISAASSKIDVLTELIRAADIGEVTSLIKEQAGGDSQPTFYAKVEHLETSLGSIRDTIDKSQPAPVDFHAKVSSLVVKLNVALAQVSEELVGLRAQAANRSTALVEKKREVRELVAAVELSRSWGLIESQVRNAKEGDRLRLLVRALPNLSRSVTELSKTASDQLINQNFDKLFAEECLALRAPNLTVEFIGRQGKAQRRKVLSGNIKPSKVLSEGEQKVLAMADFLAEARLSGTTAPVIFDDPVSSLDHRRINEVAKRVARLADENQVIVFTHDIFFATTLLSLFEKSKRCAYYQVTDDEGIGKVTRASGPRWDTLSGIKKEINKTIQAAKLVDGEARAALVRTGYDWIRAWCEVFTETELLKGVTQRYQPNVRMTTLAEIKVGALPGAIKTVTRIFEDACRSIEGHSQPLPTLGVSPTLSGLEDHWRELQQCKKTYDAA